MLLLTCGCWGGDKNGVVYNHDLVLVRVSRLFLSFKPIERTDYVRRCGQPTAVSGGVRHVCDHTPLSKLLALSIVIYVVADGEP